MTIRGCDYAFETVPAPALQAAGVRFVFRYVSTDPAKNLTAGERDALHGAGIAIGLVWETTGTSVLGGYNAGHAEATQARAQATALGFPVDLPLYYAVDFPETAGQAPAVLEYLRGASDADDGKDHVGIYGGLEAIESAAGAGYTWLWQTYAWSNGQWAPAVQIRQTLNGARIGGLEVDLDEAVGTAGLWLPTGTPGSPGPQPVPAPTRPTLTEGTCGYWVEVLQRSLMLENCDPRGVDARFGPATLAAVKGAQQRFGIRIDGIVGPVTWAHLEARTLVVQHALIGEGLGAGGSDSVAGPATAREVLAAQGAHHLAEDGLVGPLTSRALGIPAP